jgi:hypothetical protein
MQGIETRASLDMSGMDGMRGQTGMGMPGMNKMMAHSMRNGRVILAVTDASTADIFHNAFMQLPAQIELVPAMGAENVWITCQQVRQPALSAAPVNDVPSLPWNCMWVPMCTR